MFWFVLEAVESKVSEEKMSLVFYNKDHPTGLYCLYIIGMSHKHDSASESLEVKMSVES